MIAGLGYREDVRGSFVDLGILTIPSRYIFECLLYAHSNVARYNQNNFYHPYDTRNGHSIRLEFLRLHRSRISVNYYAPVFYNRVPNNIKLLGDNHFKNKIKTFLLSKAYYSIDEFLNSPVIF